MRLFKLILRAQWVLAKVCFFYFWINVQNTQLYFAGFDHSVRKTDSTTTGRTERSKRYKGRKKIVKLYVKFVKEYNLMQNFKIF